MAYLLEYSWTALLFVGIIGILVGILLNLIINRDINPDTRLKFKSLLDLRILTLNSFYYILVFILYGNSIATLGNFLFGSLLLLIAFIDFKTMLIPNWTLCLILLVGLIIAFLNQEISWIERLIGFFSASSILFVIAILSKGGMGGGDIKLMAVAGFYLGWKLTLWSLLVGSIIGGIIGVAILISGKGKLKTEIPFGPFLVAGILCSVLFGDQLIEWYLNMILL